MNGTCHSTSSARPHAHGARRRHGRQRLLLAGLGSVMMIARQVAYTPSAATRRTEAADVLSELADELRYATLIIQQTPRSWNSSSPTAMPTAPPKKSATSGPARPAIRSTRRRAAPPRSPSSIRSTNFRPTWC